MEADMIEISVLEIIRVNFLYMLNVLRVSNQVREYCLDQYQQTCGDGERLLMDIILRQILADPQPDTGVAVQLAGILRMLLDPETFAPNENKNSFLG